MITFPRSRCPKGIRRAGADERSGPPWGASEKGGVDEAHAGESRPGIRAADCGLHQWGRWRRDAFERRLERAGEDQVLARLHGRGGEGDRQAGRRVLADASGCHGHAVLPGRQQLRAPEDRDRDRGRRVSGHLLPVRIVRLEHRDGAADRGPQRVRRERPERELGRLLAGLPACGDGRWEDRRVPGARRQPRPRLQQEALRRGRSSTTRTRTGRGPISATQRRH